MTLRLGSVKQRKSEKTFSFPYKKCSKHLLILQREVCLSYTEDPSTLEAVYKPYKEEEGVLQVSYESGRIGLMPLDFTSYLNSKEHGDITLR